MWMGLVLWWLGTAPPADVEATALAVAQALQRGDFEAAAAPFDATMRAALPPPKLAEVWGQVGRQAGPLAALGATRRQPHGAHTLVFVELRFRDAPLELKLAFDAAGRVAGLFVVPPAAPPAPPPPYARPEAFTETEVAVKGLPGTLTLPQGAGPFAAVVLVHGSGPGDRDASVGPNRPFRDLAWGLASRGVAALRYEKRTRVHPEAFVGRDFTVREEAVDDALAAAALLRERAGIDPARVFVVGHSLGGTLAPRIAREDPRLAGLVLLAPAARPVAEAIVAQTEYVVGLDGPPGPEAQARLDAVRRAAARLRAGELGPGEVVFGAPAAYWRDLAAEDPVATAAALARPMLVLQGGRDYQVTDVDFDRWRAALEARPDVTLRRFADLNHLFMTGTGASRPTEYERPGHVAPEVVDAIAGWIRAR